MNKAALTCFEPACRSKFSITDVIYNCPKCGGLLEVTYDEPIADPLRLKHTWRERRRDNSRIEQSGVWRYRELISFLDDPHYVVTLREGNTPLLTAPKAAEYLTGKDLQIEVNLGTGGTNRATVWTCDLSAEYVKINAEYLT